MKAKTSVIKTRVELMTQRRRLGLNPGQLAVRAGCNRTTIARLEAGITLVIPRTKIMRLAAAYEIDVVEFAKLVGYPDFDPLEIVASDRLRIECEATASVEDLEFLISVARGLDQPMNLAMIRELLIRRKH